MWHSIFNGLQKHFDIFKSEIFCNSSAHINAENNLNEDLLYLCQLASIFIRRCGPLNNTAFWKRFLKQINCPPMTENTRSGSWLSKKHPKLYFMVKDECRTATLYVASAYFSGGQLIWPESRGVTRSVGARGKKQVWCPSSNLTSFGSKCIVLKKALMIFWGLFGAPTFIWHPIVIWCRGIVPPMPLSLHLCPRATLRKPQGLHLLMKIEANYSWKVLQCIFFFRPHRQRK